MMQLNSYNWKKPITVCPPDGYTLVVNKIGGGDFIPREFIAHEKYKGEAGTVKLVSELERMKAINFKENYYNVYDVMPDISDIEVVGAAVNVKFADGTMEKAVVRGDDNFSLEQGISICITKKLLSDKSVQGKGGNIYNKIINKAVKLYESKVKTAEEKEIAEQKEKELLARKAAKRKVRKEKRATAERERQITIHAEAYLRAMKALKKSAE